MRVLQLDRRNISGWPGPTEGALSRGFPAWLVGAMRDDGIVVADDPVVLTNTSHGLVPGPDGVTSVISLVLGERSP